MTEVELKRFAAFYGASWPLHRMKSDTLAAARIWIGEFSLEQVTKALRSFSELGADAMQFPPTLAQLRARILEVPPPYHRLLNGEHQWPALPPEPVSSEVPEDLRYLYPKQTQPVTEPEREAATGTSISPPARQT